MSTATVSTVRDAIERDLAAEPQSVVKVYETGKLRTDLLEYVLTDQLAREFAKVVERVVDAARPAGGETDKVGIWVSGFFGSGKSHFAKLAGHLVVDTTVGGDTTRGLFQQLLHVGRPADERLRELLQQAANYRLACHLVLFDITALHTEAAERNVGITILRAFYESLGLSKVGAFAERELALQAAGRYEAFLQRYEEKSGVPWAEDRDLTTSSAMFAECLAELMPNRYATTDLAHQSLELGRSQAEGGLDISGVVDRLLRWLDGREREVGAPQRLVFVADEVGAWAGRDLNRIEQLRSLVEMLGARGRGRVWLMATSQEKLSAVVQNTPLQDGRAIQDLLQRLEARFQTNVHLESSEVGTVIAERVLRKKPTARPALEQLWAANQQQVADVAEPPGLELGGNYPRTERERFVADYPFLPYQIPAAADIFGGMRGIKVSSGARSMIGVAFDAIRGLADRELGAVVSWDGIFDSANRDNEFMDEQYLGSHGLSYIATADRDVTGAPIERPSRILKTLWLVQKSPRVPRTPKNLARLLVDRLDVDVLRLERDVEDTLRALEQHSFVRQEAGTDQWRFLSQDEVTLEKLVQRIGQDLRQRDIREEVGKLYGKQLLASFGGRITHGTSGTAFDYAVSLNDAPLKNDQAPVQLRVALAGTPAAQRAANESAANLDAPSVSWVVVAPPTLEDRLRRAIAIERLQDDEEFRRIATERTKLEARKMEIEAAELRQQAEADVERALRGGTLYWAGNSFALDDGSGGPRAGRGTQATAARSQVEEALRDRIDARYHRFDEGDLKFRSENVDKLFAAPTGDRAGLDPSLSLFSAEGHVHGGHVLVEALATYLKSSTRTAGQDVVQYFGQPPFGWPADLLRYVAAAMFVDAKLSAIDRGGKRYDDPKAPGARNLFGTQPFRTTRLEVEEESLTPAEATAARGLLIDLSQPPSDGGEVALKEATLRVVSDLKRRLSMLDKARTVELPLPSEYDAIEPALDEIGGSGSRVKTVRALLAHDQDLRTAHAALKHLEEFDRHSGFDQYRRSQRLLDAALQAGLADDPARGEAVQRARDELGALKEQRRVLDAWDGAYRTYRLQALDAFKAAYTPLRRELHDGIARARAAIAGMTEYQALTLGDQALIRTEFLGEGRPLAEVALPELRDEQQLLAANMEYSIAHLRTALAALESQVSMAKVRVINLYLDDQRRKGEQARLATWKPSEAFFGKSFTTADEVDAVFDAEKDRLKALIRDGKTVQVV